MTTRQPAAVLGETQLPRVRLTARAASFSLGAGTVVALGAANGGYFPSSWGWAAVAFGVILLWAVSTQPLVVTSLDSLFVGGLLAFTCWVALSATWGTAATSIDEGVRALIYAIGAAAALAVVRRDTGQALLGGLLTGASCISVYAVLTRLFPDRIGTFDSVAVYRLSMPLGYWNALGLFSAVAILIALALVVRATTMRVAALAALPVPLLVLTLYFTFGRGPWIALATGLLAAIALESRKLQVCLATAILAVPAGVCVLFGARSEALTHRLASVAQAAHDGRRLAALLVICAIGSASAGAGYVGASRRVAIPAVGSRALLAALLGATIVAVVAATMHEGGPSSAARAAWRTFATPPPAHTNADLRTRLFSLSGSGRVDFWRVAVHEFREAPVVGRGAGSYEAYWLSHRALPMKVRDAHSLYLETLGELGIIGLVFLLCGLAAPLVAAARARHIDWVPAAAGAYIAYLVGAGMDWDWELPAVTLTAVFIGAALIVASRGGDQRFLSVRVRMAAMGCTSAIAVFAFLFLVGQLKLSAASAKASQGSWVQAARDARSAVRWLPWSTQPWRQLAEYKLAQGDLVGARRSLDNAIAKNRRDWSLWFDVARASTGPVQTLAIARAKELNPLSPEIAELELELREAGAGHGS